MLKHTLTYIHVVSNNASSDTPKVLRFLCSFRIHGDCYILDMFVTLALTWVTFKEVMVPMWHHFFFSFFVLLFPCVCVCLQGLCLWHIYFVIICRYQFCFMYPMFMFHCILQFQWSHLHLLKSSQFCNESNYLIRGTNVWHKHVIEIVQNVINYNLCKP